MSRDLPFKPLTFNPAPFPGDDTEEILCQECGETFTMGEYRKFAWVEQSDYCVGCSSRKLSAALGVMTASYDRKHMKPVEPTKITFPYPPLTNNLYNHGTTGGKVRRYPTKALTQWRKIVVEMLDQLKIPKRRGAVCLTFYIYRPRLAGDIDGYQKAIQDALTGYAYQDDEQIDQEHSFRFEDQSDPRVEVVIEDSDINDKDPDE